MQKIYYDPVTLKVKLMATGETTSKYPFIVHDDVLHTTNLIFLQKDEIKNQLILKIDGTEKRRYPL